jgi:S1-C subfamily serine protease
VPGLSFHHLSGPRRGETDRVESLPALVGSDAAAEVRVPGLAPRHASLLLRDGEVVLREEPGASGTVLAGETVSEATLRDGDVVELGPEPARLRFRDGQRVGLLRALAWQRPRGAPRGLGDTRLLLRALAREAQARTSRHFRLALVLLAAVSVATAGWLLRETRRVEAELGALREALRESTEARRALEKRVAEERARAARAQQTLADRIREVREREAALRDQLAQATGSEVLSLRGELDASRARLATLEGERAVAERVIRDFGAGVGLVQGAYAFYAEDARPLRHVLDAEGKAQRHSDGGPVLSLDGHGAVYTLSYFGTAFLVDRGGLLLTNRHVAEPWWNDERTATMAEQGLKPRFVLFRAFFPGQGEPFELEVERISEQVDLALLRIETRGARLPVLPLDPTGRGAVAGQPVVVLGYPAGVEALLAKADAAVVRQILAEGGSGTEALTEALARRGLIRPSTTQGHIGDVTGTDIVFDAPTTHGGSGGPLFNRQGVVIGVEYAVLGEFGGTSFGVPIRHALALLRATGARGG